jgi:hypothetical protein
MPRDIKDAPTQEQIQAAQETLLTRTADAARLGGGSATDEALREPTPEEAAAQRTRERYGAINARGWLSALNSLR